MNESRPPRVRHGYRLAEVIGQGAWGKVKRAIVESTGANVAVKVMYTRQLRRQIYDGIARFHREWELVHELEHANIIKYIEWFYSDDKEKIYLVMEYAPGCIEAEVNRICELASGSKANPKTPKLELFQIRKIMKELLLGLEYLHFHHISHHDIKPSNILISPEGTLKICDFGVAERSDDGCKKCRSFFGTPAIQAPEIAANTDGTPYDGAKADIWAAGVTLYFMITGAYPFDAETIYLVYKKIGEAKIEWPTFVEKELLDLLKSLLAVDPSHRPDAATAQLHPFFHCTLKQAPKGSSSIFSSVLRRLKTFWCS